MICIAPAFANRLQFSRSEKIAGEASRSWTRPEMILKPGLNPLKTLPPMLLARDPGAGSHPSSSVSSRMIWPKDPSERNLHTFLGPPVRAQRGLVSMKLKTRTDKAKKTEYVLLEPDGSDVWRAQGVVDKLRTGMIGVIPTDTGYSFCTQVSSREGLQRLLDVIGAVNERKPLSLLCSDFSQASKYVAPLNKRLFKMLKQNLPGPYTFILPAGPELPKMIYKSGKRKWKRKTVGIRIPDDPVAHSVLQELNEPLLCSTVHLEDSGGSRHVTDLATLSPNVDFIVDGGDRPVDDTTIYDLSLGEFELVRQGHGKPIDFSF